MMANSLMAQVPQRNRQTIWMLREFPPTFSLVPGGWQLGMAPRRRRLLTAGKGHMKTPDDTAPPLTASHGHRIT